MFGFLSFKGKYLNTKFKKAVIVYTSYLNHKNNIQIFLNR